VELCYEVTRGYKPICRSALAGLYNDAAVLENFHAALGLRLLAEVGFCMLGQIRSPVLNSKLCVLAH
jgi:hypothetical protein